LTAPETNKLLKHGLNTRMSGSAVVGCVYNNKLLVWKKKAGGYFQKEQCAMDLVYEVALRCVVAILE
jgi:hypothetical protein